MTTPTPEQLRAAAGHLAKAVAEHNANGHYAVSAAIGVLSLATQEARAISILSGWRVWYLDGPEGAGDAAWLCEAARRRILLEALWREKPVLDETRAASWREVAAWKAAWAALVDELLAGTSPAPAASE